MCVHVCVGERYAVEGAKTTLSIVGDCGHKICGMFKLMLKGLNLPWFTSSTANDPLDFLLFWNFFLP